MCAALLTASQAPRHVWLIGAPQTVHTRNDLAGMHTRFVDEAEEWKIKQGTQMIREMGAPWMVEFFPWAYYEPNKGQFDWRNAERIIAHANAQGLRVIARLGFVPQWARPRDTTFTHLDADHYADFGAFAAAFAAHFRGQIHAIVLWNEPNLSSEWGLRAVDARAYVQMLRVAYPLIKRANADVTVLVGALAPTHEPLGSPNGLDDLIYLRQMYATLSADSTQQRPYDGWAIHSYGQKAEPEALPFADELNFRRAELLREIIAAHGDADLPIYITEAGWNDDTQWVNGVTPAQRIRYTLEALEYARAHWTWARCVAFWVFKLPAPAHGYRDHFTFVTPSLEPLPIYDELRQALANGG